MAIDWLNVLSTVVYCIVYPIYWFILRVLYILYWVASPIIYVVNFIKEVVLLPFRFLAQFEALWYFLGCAVLIGAICAVGCHFILRAFVVVFDLDRKPPPAPIPPRGHSAISYREARRARKAQELELQKAKAEKARVLASQPVIRQPKPASAASPVSPGVKRRALTEEIILEHTDEEEDESVF